MSELPQSIATETMNLMGVGLVVHVLDDGRRIIEAESVRAFFEAMFGEDVGDYVEAAMTNVAPTEFTTPKGD